MSTTDRKRVSIACTSCRKRKRRCDGQKPVCGLCERESRECEYTHHLEKRKPPTKCYIHALHARIALLENQLAQYRRSTNDKPTPPSILEDPQSHPPSLPQKNSTDLPFYGPESRFSSAYGHLSLLRKSDEGHYTSQQKITIVNEVLLINKCPFFLEHGLQGQLLEEFWTWQNTWPILIHEPLFRTDLFENCATGYCTPTLLAALLALSAHSTDISQSESSAFGFRASKTSLLEHAKSAVLDQIECPSLSLVLSAALISQTELLMENIALATQYIGIAIRHAMTLGFHRQNPEIDASTIGPQDVVQARSIAWAGIVMLERHISRILGQASAIRESDMEPISVPILPSVEYGLWPTLKDSKIPKLTSYSISNFQFSCDLLQIVMPALDKIYAISDPVSFEEKEDQVTKTHVAMSEFYNNLPSPLRIPSTATKQLPAHVYQFNLLYQALKIMLHRPFIRGHPSMELLHTLKDSRSVHLQSATFSAIRVSYIINSFKNFYHLHRLSPLAIESLVTASQIHLFNSKSKDEKLARRSNSLYGLNLHILKLMTPPGKEYSRATEALASLAQEGKIPSAFDHGKYFTPESAVQPKAGACDSGNISHPLQIIPTDVGDLNQAMVLEDPSTLSDISLHPEPSFDWLDLPLNDQLLCDSFSNYLWWDNPCDAGHVYCGVNGNYF